MEKVIPWDTGGGSLHLSYTGLGTGNLQIWSDSRNYTGKIRQKSIRLQTKEGNVTIELLVSQQCYKAYVEGNTLLFTDAIKAYVTNSNLNIDDKEVYVSNETIHI